MANFNSSSLSFIFHSVSQWMLPFPNIPHSKLPLPPTLYYTHIGLLLNACPKHVFCFTDSSTPEKYAASAYSINNTIKEIRIRNFVATLFSQVIVKQKYLISTTRFNFFSLFRTFTLLSQPIIQRIQSILASLTSVQISITLLWIPAHIGLLEHDTIN